MKTLLFYHEVFIYVECIDTSNVNIALAQMAGGASGICSKAPICDHRTTPGIGGCRAPLALAPDPSVSPPARPAVVPLRRASSQQGLDVRSFAHAPEAVFPLLARFLALRPLQKSDVHPTRHFSPQPLRAGKIGRANEPPHSPETSRVWPRQ